jgi:hypothetical protein
MATLVFSQPIRLLDLTGTVVSKLGIYDELRSPDYEWGQWFGYRLDQLIVAQEGGVHGFRYPSRRHPGHDAYALSSRAMGDLTSSLAYETIRFSDTQEFAALAQDPCWVLPP